MLRTVLDNSEAELKPCTVKWRSMSANDTNRNACSSCGKPTTPDAPFCPNCGAQLNGDQQTAGTGGAAQIEANEVHLARTTLNAVDIAGRKVPSKPNMLARVGWGAVGLLILMGLAMVANKRLAVVAPQDANASSSDAPSVFAADKYVAAVRGGVLAAPYNTTTVGKAFEATFVDSKWESKESAKGARYVEFTGRLKPEMYKERYDREYQHCVDAPRREAAMERFRCVEGGGTTWNDHPIAACTEAELAALPPVLTVAEATTKCPTEASYSIVKFQFVFSADGSSFSVGYIDHKAWEYTNPAKAASGDLSDNDIVAFIYH